MRLLALLFVIVGAGLLLGGVMEAVAGDAKPWRLATAFIIGPIALVTGFMVSRQRPEPPADPSA